MDALLCERVNDLRHSLFHLLNCLWAWGITKSYKEQGLDYREARELSWYPSWSNSLWEGWSCGLVHCPAGNATDSIWRVLASSDRISCWTPFKSQHSNPNPLVNQLWCIDILTPPHLPSSLTDSLPSWNLLCHSNWCSIHARMSNRSLKHSIRFRGIFPSFQRNFIAYCYSSRPDWLHFWNSPAATISL